MHQRRRLFELGEAVIAEAIIDILREEAPNSLPTREVASALGMPPYRHGVNPQHPERHICAGVLTRLAEAGRIENIYRGAYRGHEWRYVP